MQVLKKCCSWCSKWYDWNLGILLIRLALAFIFIGAGWMKIHSMAETVAMFSQVGITSFWTHVAAYAEFVSGIAMLLGIFIVPASVLIGITMIVALVKVPSGASALGNGYQILLLVVAIAMTTFGAGKYSLNRFMPKWCGGKGCCGSGSCESKCDCGTCDTCKVSANQNPQA